MTASLFNKDQVTMSPIEPGDAGIVLKSSGDFVIFSCHTDLDPLNMTPIQIEQGETLMALGLVMALPKIRAMLIEMAGNPEVINQKAPVALGQTH